MVRNPLQPGSEIGHYHGTLGVEAVEPSSGGLPADWEVNGSNVVRGVPFDGYSGELFLSESIAEIRAVGPGGDALLQLIAEDSANFRLVNKGRVYIDNDLVEIVREVGLDFVFTLDEAGAHIRAPGAAVEIDGAEAQLLPIVIVMPNLPTSDPTVGGQLWNDAGILKISAG